MSYRLSENVRSLLLMPSIAYADGLPSSVAKEITTALPNLADSVQPGMSLSDFEAVMLAEAAAAKEQFVSQYGHAFGERRSENSRMRNKASEDGLTQGDERAMGVFRSVACA